MSDATAQPTAQPGVASDGGTVAQPPAAPVVPASGTAPASAAPSEYTKERFDGLMALMNRQQEESRSRIAALESQAAGKAPAASAAPTPATPAVPVADPNAPLADRLAQLEAYLAEQQVDAARKDAIRAFPQIQPLAHLLVGETAQDIMDLAQEVANAIGGSPVTPAVAAAAAATVTPAASAAPALAPQVPTVTPGSPAFAPQTDDAIAAAKDAVRRREPGAFERLMQLQFERQQRTQV